MAALNEKILWPLVGIVIFAVLVAFYIDDRSRLAQEPENTKSNQQASSSKTSMSKTPSSKPAKPSYPSNKASSQSSGDSIAEHSGFSGSIDEYLGKISSKSDAKLLAAAKEHSGFSGSIDEYLAMGNTNKKSSKHHSSSKTAEATSMSLDEYLAKTEGKSKGSNGAYHGSIDGYLAKFGDSKQTPISTSSGSPFNEKEHKGFHGSYEEYSKRFK